MDNTVQRIFSYICKNNLKQNVEFVLSNCFFKVKVKVFQQVIGIPIGLDPAPFFSNLFLCYYQNEWIKNKTMKAPRLKSLRL